MRYCNEYALCKERMELKLWYMRIKMCKQVFSRLKMAQHQNVKKAAKYYSEDDDDRAMLNSFP